MHFTLKINRECYEQLNLPVLNERNRGKHHYETIGNTNVDYTLYPSGKIDIATKCSSNPFKIENEIDFSHLFASLGSYEIGL